MKKLTLKTELLVSHRNTGDEEEAWKCVDGVRAEIGLSVVLSFIP